MLLAEASERLVMLSNFVPDGTNASTGSWEIINKTHLYTCVLIKILHWPSGVAQFPVTSNLNRYKTDNSRHEKWIKNKNKGEYLTFGFQPM